MNNKNTKPKEFKICICGFKVLGFTQKHVDGNMKLHIVSKNHLKNMEAIEYYNKHNKTNKKVKN